MQSLQWTPSARIDVLGASSSRPLSPCFRAYACTRTPHTHTHTHGHAHTDTHHTHTHTHTHTTPRTHTHTHIHIHTHTHTTQTHRHTDTHAHQRSPLVHAIPPPGLPPPIPVVHSFMGVPVRPPNDPRPLLSPPHPRPCFLWLQMTSACRWHEQY